MIKTERDYKKLIVLVFLAAYFLVQLSGMTGFYPYGWDESVYLHTGRYIITGGEDGLLENLRPLLFPMILSPFSGSIFMSRLFVLLVSIAALWIFYAIAEKNMDSRFSWLFPVIMALFPFYYISSNSMMSEIPALFLHAVSIYLFFERRYLLSGVSAFLVFFTRFPSGIYIPLLLAGIFLIERKDLLKSASMFIAGTALGSLSSLANTWLFYPETKNIVTATIYPMLNQLKFLASPDPGPLFYFSYLFSWTALSIFAIAGIFYMLLRPCHAKDGKDESSAGKTFRRNIFIILLALVPLAYLLIMPHKEIRYLVMVIPWIVYLMIFGMAESIRTIGGWLNRKKVISKGIVSAVLIVILALLFVNLIMNSYALVGKFYYAPKELYTRHFFALENIPANSTVLASFPMIKTDAKIVIGYYDNEYFYQKLREGSYDYVYYTTEWLPCLQEESRCLALRKDTINQLENNYSLYSNSSFYNSDFLIYSRFSKDI